ncbi:MAG TPA: hypothetical protein VFB19_20240 [Mycobacterium sp.]|nr:hypothetical protein [Mycobacterium sp.]
MLSTVEMTPVTRFSGANIPVNGAAAVGDVTVVFGVTVVVTADDVTFGETAARDLKLGLELGVVKLNVLGDCSVEAVLTEFVCNTEDVGT